MWEATSNFPQADAVLASVARLAGNFYCHNEVVETMSQVLQRRVESCDHLSVFGTLVGNVLSWLEFLLVLMLGIIRKILEVGKIQ